MTQPESKTDAAALGGGVVAVAMSMFADPSPYDLFGFIVGLTLLSLIVGYIGHHARSWGESIAIAAVLGIVAVPIIGYLAEAGTAESSFGDKITTVAWITVGATALVIDRVWQWYRTS
jgi:hypothetical protein